MRSNSDTHHFAIRMLSGCGRYSRLKVCHSINIYVYFFYLYIVAFNRIRKTRAEKATEKEETIARHLERKHRKIKAKFDRKRKRISGIHHHRPRGNRTAVSNNRFLVVKRKSGAVISRNDFPTITYIGDTCGFNRREHMRK